VSPRTGLGALEVAVLAAVAEVGGAPEAEYPWTPRILDVLERDQGIGGRYAYPLLQDLAAPWRLHLPLLDPRGNWGSQHGDPAAAARHTEARLTPIGALALAAERGQIGPVPLGLIEGSLYRDGPVPPFAPDRVLEALTTGGPDAGPPVLPTGGTVEGDVNALLAGRPARLTLASTVVADAGSLVLTELPLGVTIDRVVEHLDSRAGVGPGRRYADYLPAGTDPDRAPAPVIDVRDESSGRHGIRVVCTLSPGADVEEARRWVRSVWPVTVEVDCLLPAPMRERLETWGRGDGSGLAALGALLPGAGAP
jgi:hypothetical protein